ncbi:MAG TPA: hypothetical protein VM821_01305, partial [Abditibacteriaceae bacterium]|nr:hypothetical protein [Abditibacteriaceae bacterium]
MMNTEYALQRAPCNFEYSKRTFRIHHSAFANLARMIVHPWHGIEPGKRSPEVVDCIIEVPRGSRNKYELDKKT